MFIMQNKESRLIQAARRTLRAEAILVVVILVIVSWSIFGLYKLSTGSETIFGYSFSKLKQDSTSNLLDPNSSETSLDLREELKINGRNFGSYKIPLNQSYNSAAADANRNRLIQELLTGQAELYANLSPSDRQTIDQTKLFKTRTPQLAQGLNQDSGELYQDPVSTTRQNEADFSSYQPALQGFAHKNSGTTKITPLATQKNDEIDEELSSIRDREPAESKQDDNESYVEAEVSNDTGGSRGSPAAQSPSYDGGDYQPEATEDGSLVADTEAEEPLEENAVPDSQANQQADADVIGPEQSTDGEEPSLAEEQEQAKEGSAEVDDEVDKMTQPSSGVAQQQSVPFDYTNTVKFDDSVQALPIDVVAKETDLRHSFNRTTRITPANPSKSSSNNSTLNSSPNQNKSRKQPTKTQEVSSSIAIRQPTHNKPSTTDKIIKHHIPKREKTEVKKENPPKRLRRSAESIIQAPYEIDNYLNSMNLDGLIDSAFHKKIEESSSNSPDADTSETKASNVTEQVSPIKTIIGSRRRKKKRKTAKVEKKKDKTIELVPSESFTDIRRNGNLSPTRRQDTLDYLTNLINSTNLLKTHKQSQLPPPTLSYNMSAMQEPKVSGSQKFIDFDALLSPSGNEKRSVSKYKKNNKQEKVNSKKKTALGTSKGGHKKKKLDKEEKKFLKEKRYKAAKKGKKVSKGQGGSGGKKGKKLFKDRGYKKKGFKNVAHKEEWGHKKSYFDEFRDKDFKKKWKKFDDKYNYAQMKKFQAKDEKGAKKLKEHDERFKKNDNGKWKKSFQKHSKEHKESSQKKRKSDDFD